MHVEWYGQSAFRLSDGERTVVIDPFDVEALRSRTRWDYPAIDADADVLLITHEHGDHNAAHVVGGDPATVRSTAGTHESPIGPVVAIASEHDEAAGGWSNPSGSSQVWFQSLGELAVKILVALFVAWLAVGAPLAHHAA